MKFALKQFVLRPRQAFKDHERLAVDSALIYPILCGVVIGVFTLLQSPVFRLPEIGLLVPALFGTSGIILVIVTITSVWTHMWVRLFGGKKDFTQTFKMVSYSSFPYIFLGPFVVFTAFRFLQGDFFFISLGGTLWIGYLFYLGLRIYQKLSSTRAIIVTICSLFPVIVFDYWVLTFPIVMF